jgi:hypothetical protein
MQQKLINIIEPRKCAQLDLFSGSATASGLQNFWQQHEYFFVLVFYCFAHCITDEELLEKMKV